MSMTKFENETLVTLLRMKKAELEEELKTNDNERIKDMFTMCEELSLLINNKRIFNK